VICSDQSEHRRRVETRPADIANFKLPTWEEVTARQYEAWDPDRIIIDTAEDDVHVSLAQLRRTLGC
jgi:hypothetical protein